MEPEQYIQVGKGDQLYRQAYCIFIPADENTTDKKRYLFIGNDRDPNNSALYPKTISELIRYLYKLLGLETDNDYYDMPSQETIWGMYNALLNLLGKYTDSYSINNFIPVKSEWIGDPEKEVVYYGKRGEIDFGLRNPNNQWSIKTNETFLTLHTGAFGPLYVVQDNYPIWEKVENLTVKPSPDTAYYIENDNGDKVYAGDITKFDDKKTYYTAYLLYEKATGLEEGVQYYRDINSLWGLLREFQQCRDKYQVNWTQDHPGSPSHIQNRPKIIFSDLNWGDKYSLYNERLNLSYIKIKDIDSQETLNNYISDIGFKKYGSIYEKIISPLDENQYVYIKIDSSEEYNATKEYYRLEEPLDVNLSDYSISNRWSGIKVNRENSGGTINYDPNSGITDSGQTITLIELTSNILLNLINEVEQE